MKSRKSAHHMTNHSDICMLDGRILNPENSLLRRNQNELMTILQDLAEICDKHGICWWLSSGTLLGAARHKGFIPWDDDIDIVMPRKDFKRLRKILLAEENDKYFLQCIQSDVEYVNLYMKFRKKGVRLKTLHRVFKLLGCISVEVHLLRPSASDILCEGQVAQTCPDSSCGIHFIVDSDTCLEALGKDKSQA